MKKERLKNIVLALLVLSSVILTFNIWTYEKLWPDGYNFFSHISKFFPFSEYNKDRGGSLSKEKLALAQKIIVNNASNRSIYFGNTQEYDDLITDVKDIFILALKSKEYEQATTEEWNSELKAKSIYVSYPVIYDIGIASDILGLDKVNVNVKTINDFIISFGDAVSSNLQVYIKDYTTNSIIRCPVRYDKNSFNDILTKYALETTGELPFSFELNFNKRVPEAPIQKITIDSGVLITLNPTTHKNLTYENPIYNSVSGMYNFEKIDAFLNKFGYNTNTVRKYVETDESIVYVENYGTIKVTKDGLFEYKAIAQEKGIPLGSANDSFNKTFTQALNFVTDLWNDVVPEKEINLGLTSDVIDPRNKEFKLIMCYYSDGTLIRDELKSSTDQMYNGVEMTIYNGRIISFRQLFRVYEPTSAKIDNLSTIEALDVVFNEGLFEETDSIKDLNPAYTFKDGNCYMTWVVENQNNKSVLIKR